MSRERNAQELEADGCPTPKHMADLFSHNIINPCCGLKGAAGATESSLLLPNVSLSSATVSSVTFRRFRKTKFLDVD